MTTVAELASKSLRLILVKSAPLELTSQETDDYIQSLNDYMLALEADGIDIGYTEVSAGTDVVTVPKGAIRGIAANMAIEVAPEYGTQVSPAVVEAAREGMRVMLRICRMAITSSYPSTLPMGSGSDDWDDRAYFDQDARFYLNLIAGVGDIPAQSTDYPLALTYDTEIAEGFATTVSGLAKFKREEAEEVTLSAQISVTGDGDYTLAIHRNGAAIESSSATLSATATTITLTKGLTVFPGDELQVVIQQTDTPLAGVVSTGYFKCQ
jgi:hypothetical protein